MSRTLEPPPVSHTACYDPPVPWSAQLVRSRWLAPPPQRHGARAAHCSGDAAMRGARARSAAWTGAPAQCALERAVPEVPRRRPSNPHLREQGGRVRDECRARQAHSFERRLHVPARHQSSTVAEDPATRCGAPTNRQARVGRGVSASSETRGHASSRRKMRSMSLLVSIVVCVLT